MLVCQAIHWQSCCTDRLIKLSEVQHGHPQAVLF